MPVHLENESALIAEAQAGNREAFARFVRQYSRNIFRLALNITEHPHDAEDVLQDSFMKAFINLGQFHGDSRFYTWLVRIAVNESLMKLRRRRADTSVSLDEPIETGDSTVVPRDVEDWDDNPEQRYAKSELQQILSKEIGGLELPYRSVFLLRDVEHFSTEETAETLGLSVPAVKSRLLRARLKLRERLNKYFKRG